MIALGYYRIGSGEHSVPAGPRLTRPRLLRGPNAPVEPTGVGPTENVYAVTVSPYWASTTVAVPVGKAGPAPSSMPS